ncbi:ClbS/DfsB family four-helix bundle protein [Microbacterium ulmi]|uniref:ClbS/DfsB family four-helix bundle protein n=1 Tax=Microbacterium ulmi TaxID=179095 RepID=A0A7Y2LXT5_9MICO|nr:ClbS/DfsB family four-helix bundle protein [Microbacterium ulmi]NII70787.1 hypothetical protein [Microbacterium ulmi]NNH02804.1 ClbS/DfsB family four-helix bundle protein [Microbacterium ulmi]
MKIHDREELIRRNDEEYSALTGLVARVRAADRVDEEFAGDARDRNVRDVLAHLHAWHLLLEGWYEDGMIGGSPALPAPGYTWSDLDALNVTLRDRWVDAPLEKVEALLDASHRGLQRLVSVHSDAQLFDGGTYPWTQGSALGSLCLECGGNHYRWGRAAIGAGLGIDVGV